mgnify:CR=1 FL=1
MLAAKENFAGLARMNRELIGRAEAVDAPWRVVLDMDSTGIPVYGQQEQSACNGHFESTCYHPLLLFNREGDCLSAKLRPGNVHSADGCEELLPLEIDRQQKQGKQVVFRADAAFAKPEVYEALEERAVKYTIRIPANDSLERDVAELLTRPAGGGEGGVPLGRVVPPRRVHRDQPGDRQPGGGAVLQQAGHGRAMDQGRQASGEDDPAELPSVPGQRSAAVAERDRLKPGEPVAAAGAAAARRPLVVDESATTIGEDRRSAHQARSLLLAVAGRGPSDAAAVVGARGPGRRRCGPPRAIPKPSGAESRAVGLTRRGG